jgi:hypothetical protein
LSSARPSLRIGRWYFWAAVWSMPIVAVKASGQFGGDRLARHPLPAQLGDPHHQSFRRRPVQPAWPRRAIKKLARPSAWNRFANLRTVRSQTPKAVATAVGVLAFVHRPSHQVASTVLRQTGNPMALISGVGSSCRQRARGARRDIQVKRNARRAAAAARPATRPKAKPIAP